MSKPKKKKYVFTFFISLFFLWGSYRALFSFSEPFEEIVIKPLLWLGLLFFFLKKEKKGIASLGFTEKNFFQSLFLALLLGAVFSLEGIIVNFIKYEGFSFSVTSQSKNLFPALGISFVTAVTEEITFRGYVFGRLWEKLKSEWLANIISSFLWVLIHLPVMVLVWRLPLETAFGYFFLVGLFGVGASFLYAKTGNIFSSIFLHVFWQWPIILFS